MILGNVEKEIYYNIDTFNFQCIDNRLYILGLDEYALHYDLNNNYDVINALIDFSRPHTPDEIDFRYWRNIQNKDKILKFNDMSYPTEYISEEGVRRLYNMINGKQITFNFSYKNYVESCENNANMEYVAPPIIRIQETKKSSNRNLEYPGYDNWRRSILNRDKVCQCCGHDDKLEVHHLFGYKENPSLAVNKFNGITLCKFCHDKYHSVYGLKGINPVDFVDFIKRFGVR